MHLLRRRRLNAIYAITALCLTALTPAFAQDPSSLTSVRTLLGDPRPHPRAVLRGAITYIGRELIVQDQTGAMAVEAPPGANLSLGDEVEVSGRFEKRSGIPIIRDATVEPLWAGSTPLPLAMTPDEAAEGAYNGMLISTEGRLVKINSEAGPRLRLTVESGSQLFTCILDGESAPEGWMPDVGATIRCTGVLAVEQGTVVLDTGTFGILTRDHRDIHIVAAAPWWTPRHLVFLFLLLLLVVWVAYRIHLRNIRARMQMILDERSRIAREIHDTLAQGFAGIALQLQGVDRTLEKKTPATHAHLSMALQMVRRSRAEAHRSIATLRTLHSYQDLASMAERLVKRLTQPAHITLIIEQRGIIRQFSDEITTQILRISQEAVANIIDHARATSVTFLFDYQPTQFILEIADNGIGFDPEHAKSLADGHFGIAGMRERAAQITADFSIASNGQGTRLRLALPLNATRFPRSWFRISGRRTRHTVHDKSSLDPTYD